MSFKVRTNLSPQIVLNTNIHPSLPKPFLEIILPKKIVF